MALIATVLFFIVFVQLFLALSLYLWKVLYDYFKAGKARKPPPPIEEESMKLHVSGGLLEVNRLPEEQGKEKE